MSGVASMSMSILMSTLPPSPALAFPLILLASPPIVHPNTNKDEKMIIKDVTLFIINTSFPLNSFVPRSARKDLDSNKQILSELLLP